MPRELHRPLVPTVTRQQCSCSWSVHTARKPCDVCRGWCGTEKCMPACPCVFGSHGPGAAWASCIRAQASRRKQSSSSQTLEEQSSPLQQTVRHMQAAPAAKQVAFAAELSGVSRHTVNLAYRVTLAPQLCGACSKSASETQNQSAIAAMQHPVCMVQ